MDNRIYRSRDTKMVAGVCGGIAEMFNLDPTLVRLITLALIFFSGFAFLLIYAACAIIIPLEPSPGYILKQHPRPSEPVHTPAQAPKRPSGQTEFREAADAPQADRTEEGVGVHTETSETAADDTKITGSDETVIRTEADRY